VAPPHHKTNARGIEGIVREDSDSLAFHFPAIPAVDASHLELEIHRRIAARQIARPPRRAVVPPGLHATAATIYRFFELRVRVTLRAFESPKAPHTVGSGWKPGKAYTSPNRCFRFDQ